jgi:hypothetical protein
VLADIDHRRLCAGLMLLAGSGAVPVVVGSPSHQPGRLPRWVTERALRA